MKPKLELPRIGNWMQTYSGKKFWPLDPRTEDLYIVDIAHATSMICRYGGHCAKFYSVAEHSVHVSYLVPAEHAFAGLMHDATEAYLVDMPRPIKQNMPQYKEIEAKLWKVIAVKYNLPEELPQAVHDADVAMLFAERDQILATAPVEGWGMGLTTPIIERPRVFAWSPEKAKERFLERFKELTQ